MKVDLTAKKNRKFIRIAVPCKIFISAPRKNIIDTHTENIGGGGIRVNIKDGLPLLSIVGLELDLKMKKIITQGKILYSLSKGTPLYYSTGIEFHNMKEVDRRLVNNFIKKIILES